MKVQTSGMGSGITVQFTIGDMTQSGFAAAAMLAGGESDPGGDLSAILEVMAMRRPHLFLHVGFEA